MKSSNGLNVVSRSIVVVISLCATSAFAQYGPFHAMDRWYLKVVDIPNGGLLTSNPNRGGQSIDYSVSNSNASTTTTEWEISFDSQFFAQGRFGIQLEGTNVFSYQLSGTVSAPPAGSPVGSINHHEVFLAYNCTVIEEHSMIRYFTDGIPYIGHVTSVEGVLVHAAVSSSKNKYKAIALQSCKDSQENYGDDNYPRPNPYIYRYEVRRQKPEVDTTVNQISTETVLFDIDRDWE